MTDQKPANSNYTPLMAELESMFADMVRGRPCITNPQTMRDIEAANQFARDSIAP